MKQKSDKPRGFVFYPQDYFGDRELRRMPFELRIVWVEAFLLMSDSPRRGVLLHSDGTAYTAADMADAIRGKITVETVEQAFDWAIKNKICDVDRRTGALISRKMVRDEIRRKTGQKTGKKGGNPALIKQSKQKEKEATLKGRDILPIPNPIPNPIPSSPVLINSHSLNPSADLSEPPAENRGGRPRDLAMDCFTEKHVVETGTGYSVTSADGVQLAKLRKRDGIPPRASPDLWPQAVANYFASPLSDYTLADLASRFAIFRNSPLDRYGKPINHAAAKGESDAQQRARRTSEAADRVRDRLLEEIGNCEGDRVS